jgi:hypothetical protein
LQVPESQKKKQINKTSTWFLNFLAKSIGLHGHHSFALILAKTIVN